MDFLECKVCNIQYDEENHRPRNASCGHELCSKCIRALINDNLFLCPKCRHITRVNCLEDLPVNYGLIDVVRAFKTQNDNSRKQTNSKTSGASKDDVCKAHNKIIRHRCLKCERWICEECHISHTALTGCSIIESHIAIESLKSEHSTSTQLLVTQFDDHANILLSKIENHEDKITELENAKKQIMEIAENQIKELSIQVEEEKEDMKKIQLELEVGEKQKKKAVESKIHLSEANTPFGLTDKIEVLEEMNQALSSWCITNMENHFPDMVKDQINMEQHSSGVLNAGSEAYGQQYKYKLQRMRNEAYLSYLQHMNEPYSLTRMVAANYVSVPEERNYAQNFPDSQQIFIGNIPSTDNITRREEIERIFSRFGEILNIRIHTHAANEMKKQGIQKPYFGFITFASEFSVNSVLVSRPFVLEGNHCINVERKKSRRTPS